MFSPAARHSDERCIKLGCRFYISMFPGVVIATTVNNMAHEDNHRIQRSKRVFINNVDIYASNYIGKVSHLCISGCRIWTTNTKLEIS